MGTWMVVAPQPSVYFCVPSVLEKLDLRPRTPLPSTDDLGRLGGNGLAPGGAGAPHQVLFLPSNLYCM
jgi:hypothetical protein